MVKCIILRLSFLFFIILISACTRSSFSNQGQLQSFSVPLVESAWIRNGDPIVFENHRWYPADDTESLRDSEVYQVGDFQGVSIFVEKADVRPFQRLYTKFANGRFRYYERTLND